MNKTIFNSIAICFLASIFNLLCFNQVTANSLEIGLEPEQSPPIKVKNYYIRASVYNTNHLYIKDGIMIGLSVGRTAEETYLGSSDGQDITLVTEVNCKTGKGYVLGMTRNGMPSTTSNPKSFNIFTSPKDPHAIAIYYACNHFLKRK